MGGIAIEIRDNDPENYLLDRIVNFLPTQNVTKIQWERKRLTINKSQRQRTRLTLTPKGLEFLKEHGHEKLIPDLSENKIKDKSKGSAFAKTLVCIQGSYLSPFAFLFPKLRCIQLLASWFCIQCLTRFAQGLAISLLELNTLGHAICTLFIYRLWWGKPLDIVEPETVLIHPSLKREELEMAKLIAAMCSASRLDKKAAESDHLHFGGEMFAFPVHCGPKDGSDCHVDLSGRPLSEERYRIHMEDIIPGQRGRLMLESLFKTLFRVDNQANVWVSFQLFTLHSSNILRHSPLMVHPDIPLFCQKVTYKSLLVSPRLCLSVKQSSSLFELVRLRPRKERVVILRSDNGGEGDWDGVRLLGRSIRNSTKKGPLSAFRSPDSSPNYKSTTEMPRIVIQYSDIIRWQLSLGLGQYDLFMPPKDSLTDRVRNLPRFQDYDNYLTLFIGFGFVGLIYGGLHCVAWNAPFTTSIERILWRISSITIAVTGVLVACVFSWTRFPPFWQEPTELFNDIYEFVGTTFAKPNFEEILLLCTGAKLALMPQNFIKRQPIYQNNRLVKVLCETAYWTLILPCIFLIGLIIFLIYLFKVLLDIFTILFMVLYVLARIYLVVISFINLAHLPDSAYQLPQWSRYVPHIG